MKKKTAHLRRYDENTARYIARIADRGANAKALKCLEDRRAAGEQVRLFIDDKTREIVVAPVETDFTQTILASNGLNKNRIQGR